MKIKKCNKLVCNLSDKNNYFVHIRTLKQALNHGLILKEVHKVIQFNQKAWLKSYIDTNTKLRTEAKNDFEKEFLKLMNNADIKLVTANKKETVQCQKLIIRRQKCFQKIY